MNEAAEKASETLWEQYKESNTLALRNELVLKYSYIVNCIVAKMRSMCRGEHEVGDLVNQGFIALIDAVERYDPTRGSKFESFASIKINGAIIDYVRKHDMIPRRVRKAGRDIENAHSYLWTELLREPTEQEMADYLGKTEKEYRKEVTEVFNANVIYFDELIYNDDVNTAQVGSIVDENLITQPETYLNEKEFRQELAKAIDSLSEKERTVISLYYYENLKLKEISYVLDVSESRTCQIHISAIGKLKEYMKKNRWSM